MIIEKDTALSEERSIAEVMNNYFANIFKSLNMKYSSESNVGNTGSNIRHSFKNVTSENHVIVEIIRGKKRIMESSFSNQSKLKSSKR